MTRELTAQELKVARQMLDAKINWAAIGRAFQMDRFSIRRRLDPEWGKERRRKCREYKRIREPKAETRRIQMAPEDRPERLPSKPTASDIMRGRAHIVEDTRTLTARLLGDPPPGYHERRAAQEADK